MDHHHHSRKEPETLHPTNWHIITGAPCSGKTSVIKEIERFDFLKDGIRSEDEKIAARLNDLLLEAYGQAGYNLIRVPVMSVKDRTDMVLEKL